MEAVPGEAGAMIQAIPSMAPPPAVILFGALSASMTNGPRVIRARRPPEFHTTG
jgi:hypothetical protein